ncbi:MAG: ATP-dependent RecD-like DNA helicase [Oscillospiraceae bacterium]|nr:ATP-dependent RecD-like DNA helicase [Oscillospiraceae bacterium]
MSSNISGVVEKVIYSNSETFFTVLDLDVNGELVSVVGELGVTIVGEELTVYGDYVTHPTYGVQFRAIAAKRNLPSGANAILKYLAGGVIPGVGEVLARRIVEQFQDQTLEVIDKTPEQLAEIKGISKEKAEEIGSRFRDIFGIREAISELATLQVSTHDAVRLYKEYGNRVSEMISDNPYILCGFPLYKEFQYSDDIAMSLSFEADSETRVRSGIIYILRHNMLNGHTCSPAERLIDKAASFLEVERDRVEIILWESVDNSLIRAAEIDNLMFIFLPALYDSERYIAERIGLLGKAEYRSSKATDDVIDSFEQQISITYEPLQRKAIVNAIDSGALVITGGPGTGKTTALNAIITLCEAKGERVAIAAPTGRAAKRIAELTGHEAKTIHRLLEVDYRQDEEIRFVHNQENLLECDLVIVDEMSMVDVVLFESLLKGLKPDCRLVMVGDSNQLPAVGAGNLLQDIISSRCCQVVEFKKIFRQAAASGIVVEAHNVVAGNLPDLSQRNTNFFFIPCTEHDGPSLIASLSAKRLPERYMVDPFIDIQVLSPSRIGSMGTESLNLVLSSALNGSDPNKKEISVFGRRFREGDKVMQTRNNYDIGYTRKDGNNGVGVYNGDIGRIDSISPSEGRIAVEFDDDRRVIYSLEEATELETAYAVTVHKSQGSEYPVVILALYATPSRLRYRNLLYTAITRAKDLLVVIGDERVVEAMVENDKKSLRYTGLESFINSHTR